MSQGIMKAMGTVIMLILGKKNVLITIDSFFSSIKTCLKKPVRSSLFFRTEISPEWIDFNKCLGFCRTKPRKIIFLDCEKDNKDKTMKKGRRPSLLPLYICYRILLNCNNCGTVVIHHCQSPASGIVGFGSIHGI